MKLILKGTVTNEGRVCLSIRYPQTNKDKTLQEKEIKYFRNIESAICYLLKALIKKKFINKYNLITNLDKVF